MEPLGVALLHKAGGCPGSSRESDLVGGPNTANCYFLSFPSISKVSRG